MEPVVQEGGDSFLFHRELLAYRIDSYYCVRRPNGKIGCCPDGKLCYGSPEEETSNGQAEVLSGGEVASNESKNVAD